MVNLHVTVVISNLGYHGVESVFIITEETKLKIKDCDMSIKVVPGI